MQADGRAACGWRRFDGSATGAFAAPDIMFADGAFAPVSSAGSAIW
jgi:hypothetical protein